MLIDPRDEGRGRDSESRETAGSQQERQPLKIRAAQRLRRMLGSWTFLTAQIAFVVAWIVVNKWLRFDPPPYLTLNLNLTILASLQAVLVLISERDK